MFVDQVKIYARAGHGGKGCVAFHREAFRPKGGPSGGDGGRGGDVILEASHDLNNLIAQFYEPRLIAKNGLPGQGKGMHGAAGKDILIKVPCGTLIWKKVVPMVELPDSETSEDLTSEEEDLEEGEFEEGTENPAVALPASLDPRPILRYQGSARALEFDLENLPDEEEEASGESIPQESVDEEGERYELVADLTEDGQRLILCKGGRGGMGNKHFATSRNQTPRFAQPGEAGDEGDYRFELRLIADVGLVGFPNAGKSTLLSEISAARPKIAAYPFTTLTPQVGILEYPDYERLTICDVPGLIEGAHQNVGLGHDFLRHIQRCRALVLLLDMAGTDGRHPWDDYQQLRSELELYDPAMLERPILVAANKMDEDSARENLEEFRKRHPDLNILEMAAGFGEGLDAFKDAIRELAASAPDPAPAPPISKLAK